MVEDSEQKDRGVSETLQPGNGLNDNIAGPAVDGTSPSRESLPLLALPAHGVSPLGVSGVGGSVLSAAHRVLRAPRSGRIFVFGAFAWHEITF